MIDDEIGKEKEEDEEEEEFILIQSRKNVKELKKMMRAFEK